MRQVETAAWEEPLTEQAPEVGKSVNASGVRTNYHEAGSGEPVVLVHGSGPGVSAWGNWRQTIPYLAGELHVFAYDQVGFGHTDLPSAPQYGLERWRQHLLDFMAAVGVGARAPGGQLHGRRGSAGGGRTESGKSESPGVDGGDRRAVPPTTSVGQTMGLYAEPRAHARNSSSHAA